MRMYRDSESIRRVSTEEPDKQLRELISRRILDLADNPDYELEKLLNIIAIEPSDAIADLGFLLGDRLPELNQGTSAETLVLPSFTRPAKPTFSAPSGLSVQIATGDFKSQINTLSAQPGMGYLNDLAARRDVNWQPVKLAFEQWNYKQEGLPPAGGGAVGRCGGLGHARRATHCRSNCDLSRALRSSWFGLCLRPV